LYEELVCIDCYIQGQGLLVTDDNCSYAGEFSGGPNLSGKVWNTFCIVFVFKLVIRISSDNCLMCWISFGCPNMLIFLCLACFGTCWIARLMQDRKYSFSDLLQLLFNDYGQLSNTVSGCVEWTAVQHCFGMCWMLIQQQFQMKKTRNQQFVNCRVGVELDWLALCWWPLRPKPLIIHCSYQCVTCAVLKSHPDLLIFVFTLFHCMCHYH